MDETKEQDEAKNELFKLRSMADLSASALYSLQQMNMHNMSVEERVDSDLHMLVVQEQLDYDRKAYAAKLKEYHLSQKGKGRPEADD